MALGLFEIDGGIEIDGTANILTGTALPGGDSGFQDAAPVGSLYLRQDGALSTHYVKRATANAPTDWERYATASEINMVDQQEFSPVTIPVIIATALVDNVRSLELLVGLTEIGTQNVRVAKIIVSHDGEGSVDATNVRHSIYSRHRHGAPIAGITVSSALTGAAGTQVMNVLVGATNPISIVRSTTDSLPITI